MTERLNEAVCCVEAHTGANAARYGATRGDEERAGRPAPKNTAMLGISTTRRWRSFLEMKTHKYVIPFGCNKRQAAGIKGLTLIRVHDQESNG